MGMVEKEDNNGGIFIDYCLLNDKEACYMTVSTKVAKSRTEEGNYIVLSY